MSAKTKLAPFLLSGLAVGLSACATKPTDAEREMMHEASVKDIAPATEEQKEEVKNHDALTQAAFWGHEYEKNPANREAAVEFVRVLTVIGSDDRAIEVASNALGMHPDSGELLSMLGKALLRVGDARAAVDVLKAAHDTLPYDASVLGALGVAYDQTGRHVAAQTSYKQAIRLSPERASLHSNLGLSYLFTGEPELAERHLRQATGLPEAGPRERQNLAMVLSVQGKFDEAKALGTSDLPDDKVQQNIDYFRSLLTPQRKWTGPDLVGDAQMPDPEPANLVLPSTSAGPEITASPTVSMDPEPIDPPLIAPAGDESFTDEVAPEPIVETTPEPVVEPTPEPATEPKPTFQLRGRS